MRIYFPVVLACWWRSAGCNLCTQACVPAEIITASAEGETGHAFKSLHLTGVNEIIYTPGFVWHQSLALDEVYANEESKQRPPVSAH